MTGRTVNRWAIPALAAYGLAIHSWAALLAFGIAGNRAACWAAALPFVTWVYWGAKFPMSGFGVRVWMWFACAGLIWR